MQSCLKFRHVFPGNPTIFKNDHTFPRVVHLFESNTISEPSIVAPRPETSRPSCNPYSAAGFDPARQTKVPALQPFPGLVWPENKIPHCGCTVDTLPDGQLPSIEYVEPSDCLSYLQAIPQVWEMSYKVSGNFTGTRIAPMQFLDKIDGDLRYSVIGGVGRWSVRICWWPWFVFLQQVETWCQGEIIRN